MKKFNIQVIRTDEFEIEVDETVWNDEAFKDWSGVFYPISEPVDIAKVLAGSLTKLGSDYGFIEGLGYVKMIRNDGSEKKQFGEGFRVIPFEEMCAGISVRIITEDEEYEYEVEELK